MITLNHNLMASDTANALNSHYGRLQTSTQRLSSGLRINGAADDAAGLAIRELMRADIAALNQGARNANDAISMLQTFDGALGVIDEKLIRMKELAEQAATGTYDSTQRLMIDSEFQQMASEINRIANATDFNGVKLLCTKMMSWYEDEDQFVVTDPGSVNNVRLPAGKNGNPVLNGINPARYIDKDNPAKTISVSLTATAGTKTEAGNLGIPLVTQINGGTRSEYQLGTSDFKVAYVDAIGTTNSPWVKYNGTNWSIGDAGDPADPTAAPRNFDLLPIRPGDTAITGTGRNPTATVDFSITNTKNGTVDFSTFSNDYNDITNLSVDTGSGTYSITRNSIEISANAPDYTASYNEDNQTVTVTLKKGGTATLKLDNALAAGDTVSFDIDLAGEVQTVPVEKFGVDPNQKVKIHFGPGNDSAEDYYYIGYTNATTAGLGIGDIDIKTQDSAQEALVQINDAIVAKDKIRANYGALQNRFENTVANLRIQSENLQASESRISDTDVALEMTQFVRNQILTQSAVAMLAQANSMPQLVMRLIG